MSVRLFIAVVLLNLSAGVFGQVGSIKGTITDKKTGETLIGATVVIAGTTKGAITDFDGNYEIENLESGTYTLSISYVSYNPIKKEGLVVTKGQTVLFNTSMEESTTILAEVEVLGKANREAETMLLMEQKTAILATQAIGAKELSRKGVGDAEGAVTKVSGISKQEGVKNVFVRGLGDRYNATTLNGFALPSEDPEYKNISLDFFTSDMIQAVGVNKVFSADHTGDVGGALLDIKSKELVKTSELEIAVSAGTNNQLWGKQFMKTEGVNRLGYAGTQKGPSEKTNPSTNREYIDQYSFQNSLDPIESGSKFNGGASIAGGKKFSQNRHRFYLIGSYNTDYQIRNGVSRKTTTADPAPFQDYNFEKYVQYTTHLLMGNFDLNFDKHHFFYNTLYIHANNQYFSEYFGKEGEIFQNVEDLGSQGLLRRQQINDNSLLVNQIMWNWRPTYKWTIDAGAAFNYVKGTEPDRRSNYLSYYNNDTLELRTGDARQQRFYTTLTENNINVKAHLKYALSDDEENQTAIHFGYDGRFVQRDFEAPIYNEDWNISSAPLPVYRLNNVTLDESFNQASLGNGDFDLELYTDYYQVESYVNAGFINLVYQLGPKFIANAGLRVDQAFIIIDYNVNKGGSIDSDTINELYFLPSLNLKYDINDKHCIRFGASETYTLPQAKEIAPFVYVGVDFSSAGNPNLKPSTNYNFDVKWDYYISRSEILTIDGFYKYIKDPIARIDQGNSAGLLSYDNIADFTSASGVEIEFRKGIFSIARGTIKHEINFGFNGSYIHTNVELTKEKIKAPDRNSAMEGAAPIIFNTDLTYILGNEKFEWTNAIIFNYISDKVHTIGTNGYKNIFEESIPSLDFVSNTSINHHWKLSFKVKNIFNPYYQLTRESNTDYPATVLSRYQKGISFNLGLAYKF